MFKPSVFSYFLLGACAAQVSAKLLDELPQEKTVIFFVMRRCLKALQPSPSVVI